MDTMNLAEQKLMLFQKIMAINNEEQLGKLLWIVEKLRMQESDASGELQDSENDAAALTFEEWNALFMEPKQLDEYIPEYGMTLRDYRRKIYEAEMEENQPIESFLRKLDKYV